MKRFSIVDKGYDIKEVNEFIDVVIEKIEKINNQNILYNIEINKLNEKNNTLSSDEIINDAKDNADKIIKNSLEVSKKLEKESELLKKQIKNYKDKLDEITKEQEKILKELDKME